jgi:hypothetical protein
MFVKKRRLSLLLFLLSVSGASRGLAAPECRNLVIHMSDASGWHGEGTAVLVCNGSEIEVRSQVSIHLVNATEKGLCYADYSCGNVDSWCGSFNIGARTLNMTFAEYIALGTWRHASPNLPYAYVDIGFDFLQVTRSCTKLSEPVCVPMG